MKVNFDNQRLKITSKRFNPFNFSIYGIDVKSEKGEDQVDPFEMLENLAAASNDEDTTVEESIRAMGSVLKK